MSAIDYYDIKETIKEILDADADFTAQVSIEEDVVMNPLEPQLLIQLTNRRYSDADQSLSAGRKSRYDLEFFLTLHVTSFEKAQAIRIRDDLMGFLELALLRNHTLNGKVITSWIGGGEFILAEVEDQQSAFVAAGELKFIVAAEMSV